MIGKLWDLNDALNFQPPQPLQIVEVVTAKHIFKEMIVLRSTATKSTMLYIAKEGESLPVTFEENKVLSFEEAKKNTRNASVALQGSDGS